MKPKVSILICTYNCEKYIENTLKSIFDQTYKNWELLILDNNSQDKTKEILKKYTKNKKIKVIFSKKNIGAYPGLNLLLKKAKGKYIAIQDHDDLWHPDKLRKQVSFLDENTKYVGCGSSMIYYYEKGKYYHYNYSKEIDYFTFHTTLLFRNKNIKYNTNITFETDLYFMKKILCKDKKRIYNFKNVYGLHLMRGDLNNLGNKWIRDHSISEIIKNALNYKRISLSYISSIFLQKITPKLYFKLAYFKNYKKIKKKEELLKNDFTKYYYKLI
ncbi:MAG: glycosyltransferase family A protein [archaeon]|nr:glycosyltransferase family 2 protein [archaeon]